jgi:hypothetical protein
MNNVSTTIDNVIPFPGMNVTHHNARTEITTQIQIVKERLRESIGKKPPLLSRELLADYANVLRKNAEYINEFFDEEGKECVIDSLIGISAHIEVWLE